MEQTKEMNYHHPLDHLVFLSVLLINYVSLKVGLSGFTDIVEVLFIIPLKLLPFITAYLAYKKPIHEIITDAKKWIKKLFKSKRHE